MRRSFEKLLILYALKEEDLCTVLVKLPLLKMQIREHKAYIVQNYLSQPVYTSLTSLKLVYLARYICKSLTVSRFWDRISKTFTVEMQGTDLDISIRYL